MTRAYRLAALAGALAASWSLAGGALAFEFPKVSVPRVSVPRVSVPRLFAPKTTTDGPGVVVDDTAVYPESITVSTTGAVILGSANKPIIYRGSLASGGAEAWIWLKGPGVVTTLGVLADDASNTLWACQIEQPAGTPPPPRRSMLRAFDLTTGEAKASYGLTGAANLCNDITVGPDKTVYISDTTNGRIFTLKPGAKTLTVWSSDAKLAGIDGLTFVGATLYVNTVTTGHIYRMPIGADGKAGAPVDIALSQPLNRPDGMRAQGKRLFVAENGAGRIAELNIVGDRATVGIYKTGYDTPTAVQPMGDTLWVGESQFPYLRDPKLQGKSPGPFEAYAIPLSK